MHRTLLPAPRTPNPCTAPWFLHRDGDRLLAGLFLRRNLFAFAVPVFLGNHFAVFAGSFGHLLPVLVPRRPEAILSAVFALPKGLYLPLIIHLFYPPAIWLRFVG